MLSRIARNPIAIPDGVGIVLNGSEISIKGEKGSFTYKLCPMISIRIEDSFVHISLNAANAEANKQAGTSRALINNMIIGVSKGFERKLLLVGVGYRAAVHGKILNLSLGFSHPVVFEIPAGITVETPIQTEIIVKGIDKHMVGQVAANIRDYREPELYKGKGIRYSNEEIELKETKKK